MRKHLLTAAKFAVTIGAFAWVAHSVDASHLQTMLRAQDHALLLAAAVLLLLQMMVGGVRWRMILRRLDPEEVRQLTLPRALKLFYISIFFNTCLPGTIGGDVIRVFLCRAEHIPLPLAIHSVVLDRVLTLLALLLLALFGLPALADAMGAPAWLLVTAALLASCAGLALLANLHLLPLRLRETKIGHALAHLSASARRILHRPLAALGVLALTVCGHWLYCLSAFWIARSLGFPLTLWESSTLIPLVMLLSVIPISIGGWGLREAGMVGVLALVGIPKAAALMLSVQLGLLSILVSLPAGLMWLLARRGAQA